MFLLDKKTNKGIFWIEVLEMVSPEYRLTTLGIAGKLAKDLSGKGILFLSSLESPEL